MSHYMTPMAGEHLISYAYPTSENACRLGHAKTGCYVIQTVGDEQSRATYADAIGYAGSLGTNPQRWSMDHPLNRRFLSH